MRIGYGVNAVGSDANYIVYKGGMPSCSGTPNPGNTISSVNPVCSSDVFTLSLQNFSGRGATYQWQSSPDNSTWSNISDATNATYSYIANCFYIYRCEVTCSGNTGISTPLRLRMNTLMLLLLRHIFLLRKYFWN